MGTCSTTAREPDSFDAMSKTFRPWNVEQRWLLRPSVHELVPAGHVAHFVRDTVREELDLSAIFSAYDEERATRRTIRPRWCRCCSMRTAAGSIRRAGSHRLARNEWISWRSPRYESAGFPCDLQIPPAALEGFESPVRPNAQDRAYGGDRRGDEIPDWVANKAVRLERIRAAKAMLEAEAKQPPPDDEVGPGPSSGMMKSGKPQRAPDGGPPDRAQRNFTDPDSRIQPLHSKAVIAGYNAQIAVDGAHQIIVVQRLRTSLADARALPCLLADIRAVLHANPKEVSADAGYCDEQNLSHLARRRIDGYLAPGRARHSQKHAAGSRQWPKGSHKAAMAMKVKRAGPRSR
jgi:hypothetical protein